MSQRKNILGIVVLLLAVSSSVFAQGQLENPTANSIQSGQGIISGWVCQATTIELVVDGTIRVQAPYGTLRGDTQSACGDANNGFGFQVNWNELGDGAHTLVVLVDGGQFAQVPFTVKTLGVPFLTGANGTYQLQGFSGKDVTVQWSEPLQNFIITGWSLAAGASQPSAPSTLVATAVSAHQVNLSWQDNSHNEASFRVSRGGNVIATVGMNITTAQDTTVSPGMTYSYRVDACNTVGCSAGNSSTATTPSDGGGCCRICTVGKPCGDSCINRDLTCHKPPGCAC